MFDPRSQDEIELQSIIIQSISAYNIKNFCFKTKKKLSTHLILQKMLPGGSFLHYTDNKEFKHLFKTHIPVITLHGAPGDFSDWQVLEYSLQNFCRWINIFFPGMDQINENRGQYQGTMEDFNRLLANFIDSLGFQRVVLLGHSFGGFVINNFAQYYHDKICGVIYLGPPSCYWYIGFLTFFTVACLGLDIPDDQALQNQNNRLTVVKHFNQGKNQIWFQGDQGEIHIPLEGEHAICAFYKYWKSFKDINQQFINNQSMSKFIIFMASGNSDPLNQKHLFEATFYNQLQQVQIPIYNIYSIREFFKKRSFYLQGFNWENLQRNFIFCFENTGHNVHKKRATDLSVPIQLYITMIEFFENNNKKPKL